MSKTKLEFIEPIRDSIQERIWMYELQIANTEEQIARAKETLAEITKGLEVGTYSADPKIGLRMKDEKYTEIEQLEKRGEEAMKGLEAQSLELQFFDRYIKHIKAEGKKKE